MLNEFFKNVICNLRSLFIVILKLFFNKTVSNFGFIFINVIYFKFLVNLIEDIIMMTVIAHEMQIKK